MALSSPSEPDLWSAPVQPTRRHPLKTQPPSLRRELFSACRTSIACAHEHGSQRLQVTCRGLGGLRGSLGTRARRNTAIAATGAIGTNTYCEIATGGEVRSVSSQQDATTWTFSAEV